MYLDYFSEILDAVRKDHGARFCHNIKETERRYQGRWNENMISDYCWMFKRDGPQNVHNKKSTQKSLESQRKDTTKT